MSLPLSIRTSQRLPYRIDKLIAAHKAIGAASDGDRAFRGVPDRQTRNAEIAGFFLHPPRIRDGQRGAGQKIHEVDITLGLDYPDRRGRFEPVQQAGGCQACPSAWVDGKNQRNIRTQLNECFDQPGQLHRIVHIGRTM